MEKDLSGTYTEYLFDKDGEPEAENNRGTVNNGWMDSWVSFEGQHLAHYENNGVYCIYSNQVGTAGIVTDWTGAVVQDELHYPWGKVWTTMGTQTEERFASLHHRDADTNLDPTYFRMYSSDEGRWLTPDPAQADIYNPQSMSRYAYAIGNPAVYADPYGLISWSQVGWGVGQFTLGVGAIGLSVASGFFSGGTLAPLDYLGIMSGLGAAVAGTTNIVAGFNASSGRPDTAAAAAASAAETIANPVGLDAALASGGNLKVAGYAAQISTVATGTYNMVRFGQLNYLEQIGTAVDVTESVTTEVISYDDEEDEGYSTWQILAYQELC